jgi:hypothetical protein
LNNHGNSGLVQATFTNQSTCFYTSYMLLNNFPLNLHTNYFPHFLVFLHIHLRGHCYWSYLTLSKKTLGIQESCFHKQCTSNTERQASWAPTANKRGSWLAKAFWVYIEVLWLAKTGGHVIS